MVFLVSIEKRRTRYVPGKEKSLSKGSQDAGKDCFVSSRNVFLEDFSLLQHLESLLLLLHYNGSLPVMKINPHQT